MPIKYFNYHLDRSKILVLICLISLRQLWKSLGNLNKEDAMNKYVEIIKKSCPLFHVHYEAHVRHLEEIEKKRLK